MCVYMVYVCVFVCEYRCIHVMVCVWKSEDILALNQGLLLTSMGALVGLSYWALQGC